MFCKECGFEMIDSAAFCPQCGTPVDRKAVEAAVPTTAAAAGAGGAAGASGAPAGEPAPKRNARTKVIAGVVAAVVVVGAAVGIGLWWKADQDAKAAAQAAWERAHTSLVTQVIAEAPGFDDAATGIPVQITGTDLDGNAVNEVQYLRSGAMQIETRAGSYDVSFPAGYFTGAGKVVKAPGTTQHIDLEVPGDDEGSSSAAPVLTPDPYVEVPDLDVTDDLIKQISDMAKQDPDDNGKSDQLQQSAQANHQAAVEEEERRKAEEARIAARKAEITQTASDFLYCLFDNRRPQGQPIVSSRKNSGAMWGFVNGKKSLQSGWPSTRMVNLSRLECTGENEVEYALSYQYQDMGGSAWHDKTDRGRIVFGENGLIDQWYPESSPNGRLIGPG